MATEYIANRIENSIKLMFSSEAEGFLYDNDLTKRYIDGDRPVLTDRAISTLAAWLAGEGFNDENMR